MKSQDAPNTSETRRTHGGKGDKPRVNHQKYADNWERIFGKNPVTPVGKER